MSPPSRNGRQRSLLSPLPSLHGTLQPLVALVMFLPVSDSNCGLLRKAITAVTDGERVGFTNNIVLPSNPSTVLEVSRIQHRYRRRWISFIYNKIIQIWWNISSHRNAKWWLQNKLPFGCSIFILETKNKTKSKSMLNTVTVFR